MYSYRSNKTTFINIVYLQVSGDEAKRLCLAGGLGGGDGGSNLPPPRGLSTTLTTYGSVAYQLKDANMEASSTCDFVCRAMRIVNRTGEYQFLLKKG